MITALSHRQLFLDHLAQTTHAPLMIEVERAEGIYLHGPDGQRYIDLISGIGVSNVGHRHPRVIRAIQDQLEDTLTLLRAYCLQKHHVLHNHFAKLPKKQRQNL